jgi:hypothetical protein
MITFALLFVILALAVLVLLAFDKYRPEQPIDRVWIVNRRVVEELFGRELTIDGGKVIELPTVQRWFVTLRESRAYDMGNDDSSDYAGCSDFIIRTHDQQFFHLLVKSWSNRRTPPNLSSEKPVVTALTELRARRALFNDSESYKKAFGELPDIAHIRLAEKLNQYDPSVQQSKLADGKPLGHEFGA